MFEAARPYLLALAIGLLVGIERERAKADSRTHDPLGSRTFTLLALLGAVAAHVNGHAWAIAAVLALFAAAIIVVGYLRTRVGPEGEGVGVTTEVAAMATFVLGYMTRSDPWLTGMLAVIMLVVLALKPRIHAFARTGVSEKELSAALTFLVIAFVVLPLLPHRYVDPWHLVNPTRLWLLLVVIAGISFGGYIAVRALGPRWGLPVTGLSAGLVSSTAATLSLAQKSRENPKLTGAAATGIVLANVASAAAQIVVVAVIYSGLLPAVVPVIGAAVLAGAVGAALAVAFVGRDRVEGRFEIGNPLALRSATIFALMLAVILVVVSAASKLFGQAGTLITAGLGGATDVHAVTLAVSNLAATGNLAARPAVLAILLAFLANMLVKLGLAGWVGGRKLILVVCPPLVVMMAAAVAAYFLT